MYTRFKLLTNSIILFVLMMNLTLLFGQDVNVIPRIFPPYNQPFDQLKTQIVVDVINTSTNSHTGAFLRLSLEGSDNGIIIQSKEDFVYLDAFNLDSLKTESRSGNMGHFDDAFKINNLSFQGITANEVYDQGLPAGNYTLCFRLFNNDYDPISNDAPSGCTMFTILPPRAIEPPQLISPICGNEITTRNNNIVFSWTIPPGSDPSTTDYTLKMIELLPNQDPNQAFLASTVPAFFEKNVQMQNSILYGPTDPPLESGKRYAWQVIAKNEEFNTVFENEGRSEVCWFTWKPNTYTFIPPTNEPKDDTPLLNSFTINPSPTPRSSVYGKLYYNFKRPNSNLHSGAKPLKGVSVSLVVTYMFSGEYSDAGQSSKTYTYKPMSSGQASFMNDEHKKTQGQVLATTITDAEGNFNFENFINPYEEYGKVESINRTEGGEFPSKINGDVYRVLRLKVNNQYYLSPDRNIMVKPWESTDLEEVVSLVRSYNLKVTTKWRKGQGDVIGGSGAIINEVPLILTRKTVPKYIPKDEGGKDDFQFLLTIVASGTSDGNGTVIFKDLVQHNPSNSNDTYQIRTADDENTSKNMTYKLSTRYFRSKGSDARFPYNTKEKITWNHEFIVQQYEETLELVPNKPRIIGKVETVDVGSKPLSDKLVILTNKRKKPEKFPNINYVEFTRTDSQGRYRFDNLPMEYDRHVEKIKNEGGYTAYNYWDVIGPYRTIFCGPKGFIPQKKEAKILQWGAVFSHDFSLEPDGFVKGFVVDDKENPLKAIINIDGLSMKETFFGGVGKNNNYLTATYGEVFAFKAPSGKRKITVKAVGDNYMNYSIYEGTIDIQKQGKNIKPIKIVLQKKQKRIRFRVVEHGTTKAITKAKVTLKDMATFENPKLTDSNGYVEFVFENASNKFSFRIEPPDNQKDEYTSQTYELSNVENSTKFTIFKDAYLKKAAKIHGVVTINKKPLKNATVAFYRGTDALEATTDSAGKYILKGIALDEKNLELIVSKPGNSPQIQALTKTITIKKDNTVNFDLKYDNEVSMHTIFGFKVSILEKEKKSDGSFLIKKGILIETPTNKNFSFRDKNIKVVLPFTNLAIKKTGKTDERGIPIFEPKTNYVTLNNKTLELKLNSTFNVILGDDSSQLKLIDENNKGKIKGKIAIENNSFNTNNIALNGNNTIYLTTAESTNDMLIPALAINNQNVEKFGIVNTKGKELSFKVGNFEAVAKKKKSFVSNDKINLYTILKTQKIKGIVPNKLEIEIGNLVLKPTEIIPISSNKPLKIKLENWTFESENWKFDTKNIRLTINKGLIKTGTIDVPAKNSTLSSTEFKIGDFDLNQLSLGGIAKLNIIGNHASFGLNEHVGRDNNPHWELRITGEGNNPAAKLELPGFETGKSIKFKKISLLSNGEQETSTDNNKAMKFYNIIAVEPTNITAGNGYLDINAMIDLGIPKVPERPGFIRYKKENGKLVAKVAPVSFTLNAPGDVKLSISNKPEDTEIRKGFLKATGNLTDPEGINLRASITKTISKTTIVIEPDQNMKLGGTGSKFKDIKGGIKLGKNNDWDKLTFSGELDGFKGVGPGQRQTFTVHGAITADSESIDVDNIETPFGDLALTYDIKNSRFLGHLNIDQPLGGMKFKGAVDFLMGSGGWYFMAGGTGTPPGIGEISAGLIVGDSDYLAPDVTGNIMQFAYDKNVPPTIKNGVSGLFLTGQKVIPVINIPDWNLDLGILSASLGAKAGLDARIWMNFDSSGDEFGIGVMAFAHVYFEANSITCTSLGADARAELGIKGMYQTATGNFSLDGCGSISISGHIEQCFPTLVAGCKGCISTGFSEAVKLNMHFDSGGNTDVSFGFGNCSGAPLSSNF